MQRDSIFRQIHLDWRAVFERDPAARNGLEVLLAYPGFHALFWHRLVIHPLYLMHVPVLPRVLSNWSRFLTGIEIHPGAEIGSGLFIDHGTGVVIGETAEIGRNCTLYQGVTLGGTSLQRGKRHPTLENNVVVGAGAGIIGAIVVGRGLEDRSGRRRGEIGAAELHRRRRAGPHHLPGRQTRRAGPAARRYAGSGGRCDRAAAAARRSARGALASVRRAGWH